MDQVTAALPHLTTEKLPSEISAIASRRRDFVGALESVRGLAALTVLIFHSTIFLRHGHEESLEKTLWMLNSGDELLRRLVSLFFNGHLAVSLFFVLSGYVLALSLRRDRRTLGRQTSAFVGRRFFRIYPALAVNLFTTAAIIAIAAAVFPLAFSYSYTWSQITENLMLYKFSINGATWTLSIELLAIPIFLIGHLTTNRFGITGLLMLAAATIVLLFAPGLIRRVLPGDELFFVRVFFGYQFMFVFGMLVAELPLQNRLKGKQRLVKICMTAAMLAMLNARFLLGYSSHWSLLIEGGAAAVLIGLLANGPRSGVHTLLEWRPVRFLGQISYSFYLYHAMAILVVVPAAIWCMTPPVVEARPFLVFLIVALACVAVTIPFAWLSYNLVERPMMQLGRRL